MTATHIAVLGAGPHGHQIGASLRRRGFTVEMCDDTRPLFPPTLDGASWSPWVIGAAWPSVRKAIANKIHGVTDNEPWERGVVVMHGAEIGYDAKLGDHTHIGPNATISHGCVLGRFVQVCPGAQLAGDVWVGEGAFIGIGAVVIHGGIRIGAGATVGAGAVVTHNVPDGATVMGVPAKEYRP